MSPFHITSQRTPYQGDRDRSLRSTLHPLVAVILLTAPAAVAIPAGETLQSALPLRVVVNGNGDGAIEADNILTLREAIALTNGTLPLDQLSPEEKAQVEVLSAPAASRIEFDLPASQTTILLREALPVLNSSGLTVDGTTQPGYADSGENPVPVVAIAPAPQAEILRGLVITADHTTVQGLSLYGFTSTHRETASTPPADIFISSHRMSEDTADEEALFDRQSVPPQNVVIQDNWLGMPPLEPEAESQSSERPYLRSAFGVYVFNAIGTTIQRNRIANHDGSAIMTAVQAENLVIRENAIENNGFAGMPDAIRLEGSINNTNVESNVIRGNAGSGIFLFKPEGAVVIQNNEIMDNGRRLRRAAIYLLGSGHQVTGNLIQQQSGAGVVVGAFPRSDRNLIQNNQFARLEGLSIDLNAQLNVGVEDFQRGDGPNPRRNSANRRLETGNAAINAPRFLSPEFLIINGRVNLDGVADPGSQIDLYRVEEDGSTYGPLSEAIATTETDAEGRFSFTLDSLQPGERVSAIATDPRYGTSEPARNAVVK
jgi:parallel beta-helix repeat protein